MTSDWEKRALRLEIALRICADAWTYFDARTVMVGNRENGTDIRDFVDTVLGSEDELIRWKSEWRTGKEWVRLP